MFYKGNYFIHGWHGNLNAGDDAFAAVMSLFLRRYCHAEKIVMESDISGYLHRNYNIDLIQNHIYIPGMSRIRRKYFSKSCTNFILAGGSLFTQEYVESLLESPILNSRKVIALGVSVSPFTSSFHENQVVALLNKMTYVAFRDQYSFDWALSKNIKCDFVNAFDLAVLMPLLKPIEIKLKVTKKNIGISLLGFHFLRDQSTLEDDLYFFRKLALATAQVARKYEASITVYSLCRHTIFNDDIVCEAFIKALPDDIESKLVQHTGDPYITLSSMNQSTHIVSVRLHGSIFSYINQTPTLMFDYHPKCRAFANLVGLPEKFVLKTIDFDLDHYSSALGDLLETQHPSFSMPLSDAQSLALKNFSGYIPWSAKYSLQNSDLASFL